jgi:carboxyl-terminal processing protease
MAVPAGDTSAVQAALRRRAAFFYYANHYAATRDTLPPNFAVTDAVLDDFRAWIADENIQYPTAAERTLRRLRRELPNDTYAAVQGEVKALRAAVRAEKEAAFGRHGAALKDALRREIVARFADEAEVTEAMLPHDEQLTAAVDLLRDDSRYERVRTAGE